MLAWLYILLAAAMGMLLFERWFAVTLAWALASNLNHGPVRLPPWMIKVPAAVLIGLIGLTWITYLTSYLFRGAAEPLYFGNAVTLSSALIACTWGAWRFSKTTSAARPGYSRWLGLRSQALELSLTACVILIATFLMFYTLRIVNGHDLIVGLSVFSDFGPHLAVARSFSHGHNFPTEYPHFPDGNIRYHFLFQFLAGNLEYLGMPVDWAFNVPSILAIVASTLLLYALAVLLFGNRLAGIFTVILFFFRSGMAAWRFIQANGTICNALPAALLNEQFIGRTVHEDWGLWNQNVYLNQRHLPVGLGLIFLTLILVFPLYRSMLYRLRQRKIVNTGWFHTYLWSKNAWLVRDNCHALHSTVALGILTGLAGFWNGAAVIALLMILAVLAINSQHRLEFLIIAVIAIPMVMLESRFFLGSGQSAVQTQFTLGFLADDPKTLKGIGNYYLELLGLFPFALALALVTSARGSFMLALAFAAPLVLATTIQLTPDVAINHKYIMIAVMLLNIFIALLLARCWRSPLRVARWFGLALVVGLTATGVIDLLTILNKNTAAKSMHVKLDDPVLVWLERNTDRKDLLLTDWYSLHAILLSGRKIFYGWPYYAWGAGYPTAVREKEVQMIYGANSQDQLRTLVQSKGIAYVVIDPGNRESKLYQLNEALLRATFPVVYDDGSTAILKADRGNAKVN